jgi:hypothetical protein
MKKASAEDKIRRTSVINLCKCPSYVGQKSYFMLREKILLTACFSNRQRYKIAKKTQNLILESKKKLPSMLFK